MKNTCRAGAYYKLFNPALRTEKPRRLYAAIDMMPLPGHFVSHKRETRWTLTSNKSRIHKIENHGFSMRTVRYTICH